MSREATSKDVQSMRDLILWFIGSHAHVSTPTGEEEIKENDFSATRIEITRYLQGHLVSKRDGSKFKISLRTFRRRIKELTKEEYVGREKKGVYQLTESGKERWSFINSMLAARTTLPTEEPTGVFFSLGSKMNGQTSYIDFVVRVTDLDIINSIEKTILENTMSHDEYKKLGLLLSMTIMFYFKGIFGMLPELMKGKEEAFSDVIKNIPLYKKFLEPK